MCAAAEGRNDSVESFYWEGMKSGELRFQRCEKCGNTWLPPMEECPRCLSSHWEVAAAKGAATLVSWVIYHVSPHPKFADKVPYNVAVVELDEGPRTVTNLVGVDRWDAVFPGARLKAVVDMDEEMPLVKFRVV